MLTTTEAAAILSERGMADRDGGPVKPSTVHQWCKRGKFPNAYSIGGRVWQIPQADIDAFVLPTMGRPKLSKD